MLGHYSYAPARRLLAGLLGLLLLGFTLGLNSCKDSTKTQPAPAPTIRLETSGTLGAHLVDADGNTLYYFARDLSGANNCTGGCASVWPVFYSANLVLGDGLRAEDFGTVTASDGRSQQTTYKGWPLYYYAPANTSGQNVREAAGQTSGEAVGGVWFVVRPDYSVMLARTSVTHRVSGQSSLKSFLIDSQGRTLYTFAVDQTSPTTQPTNCTGGCISTWPVYLEPGRNLPSTLRASDFGAITRTDGPGGATRQQTTYKGMPLYYYTPDAATRNRTDGEGVGNVWSVAAP